jgi:pimeloyl-ACP methyl ester carboxylesterase
MQRNRLTLNAPACGVALAVLLFGCAAPSAGTASPSPTVQPSASQAAAPSPTARDLAPSPSPRATPLQSGGLRIDTVARVVTDDLVIRSAPGVGPSSEILPDRLDAMLDSIPPEPQLLFLVEGPVSADGYEWYLVQAFTPDLCVDVCPEPPFGWVAAGSRDGEAWIEPYAIDCPEPNVESLMWLSEVARLVFEETGHGVPQERPAEFVREVGGFLV